MTKTTTTTSNLRAPVVEIEASAWDLIQEYVAQCPVEINGFAYVRRVDARTFRIDDGDVFITPQQVTMGSADLNPEAVYGAMKQAEADGRAADLHFQWHSHVDGQTYFSSRDMQTIDAYGDAMIAWMISLVTNKRGEYAMRLDTYHPFRTSVPMDLRIIRDADLRWRASQDIEEMVEIVKPKPRVVVSSGSWKGNGAPTPLPVASAATFKLASVTSDECTLTAEECLELHDGEHLEPVDIDALIGDATADFEMDIDPADFDEAAELADTDEVHNLLEERVLSIDAAVKS